MFLLSLPPSPALCDVKHPHCHQAALQAEQLTGVPLGRVILEQLHCENLVLPGKQLTG